MKVQEYVLTKPHEWGVDSQNSRVLPAGAFVKPVEERYVPTHVKEAWADHLKWSSLPQVYIYSCYGFLVVPASIVRRLD